MTDEPKVTDSVSRVGRHIFLYGPMVGDAAVQTQKGMLEANRELADMPEVSLYLHINSNGGWLNDGFALADAVRQSRRPIITVAEGHCLSAGTLVLVVGTTRVIRPNTMLMIHQLSAGVYGTMDDMKTYVAALDKWHELMVRHYRRYTKMTEPLIRELLKRDTWFTAEEAVHAGLADTIYDPV